MDAPALEGQHLLVGLGQFCESLGHDRVTVLDVGAGRPHLRWEGAVSRPELDAWITRLAVDAASVRRGETDTMARTRWRLAWTTDGQDFALWDRLGRRVATSDGVLRGRHRDISVADIEGVVATLSPGWLTRTVNVRTHDGRLTPIARRREAMTKVDPTYDFIDLTFDASWTVKLAAALANALGVESDCSAFD